MARSVEEYLKLVIPRISKKIIDSVREGSLLDKPLSEYDFYQSFTRTIFKLKHDYNVTASVTQILDMCKKYMVEVSIRNGKSREEAVKYYSRFFDYKRQRVHSITLESLTYEVIEYLKNGGTFENKSVKSYPFYEKFHSFTRANEQYNNMSFLDVFELVKSYYFENQDKFTVEGEHFSEEDFFFSKALPTYTVTVEALTKDVVSFLKNGGKMSESSVSSLPFFRRFKTYIEQKEDKENWDFYRVLNEVMNYYFEKVFPYEDESERLSEKDFVARATRIEEITLDLLARDLASYVLNEGSLMDDEIRTRDLPFDRRFRSYLANQRAKGISIDYADLMEQVVEYYFSNIAPTVEEKDRLSREDLFVEKYHKYINLCRSRILRKMNKVLQSIADKDGCVDGLYEDEKTYTLMSNLANEYGMTIFEIVALLLPENSKLYLTKGHVHTEYISDIECSIRDFAHKYGVKNFISNVYKYDRHLLGRLEHLSRYFPGGTQSVSDVLSFFGICDETIDAAEYESINESEVIEIVRKKYQEAISDYFKENGDATYIDMEWINKRMNIVGDYPLYRKLMLLALKENCTLVDYLHSKEIVCYEEDTDFTDLTQSRRKTINGVYIPSFEYVIGQLYPRLSRTMVKNGKEYTFFLRSLMRQKLKSSDIINGENYSDDDKLEERIRIANSIIEEAIDMNYHSTHTKKRN